jgi:DNA polymerase (family 10)
VNASSPFTATLRELADLTEVRGSAPVAADLRRAIARIESLDPTDAHNVELRARRDRLHDEPGISPTILWRLREVAQGGGDAAVRAARAGVPHLIRRLLDLAALTSAEALTLVRQLGILTLADLATALDDGRVRAVVGETLDARLRQAANALEMEPRRLTLGRAWEIVEPLLAAIRHACPGIDGLEPAGDVRRCEPLVAALVIVGHAADPSLAIDALCAMPVVGDVLHRSGRRAVIVHEQVEIDVRITAVDEHGTVLFRATGSRAHVAAVHQRRPLPRLAQREEDVYAHAGLDYIPPEIRHGDGEVGAAAEHRIPALVAREQIRGDLHMHTTYSDGRDTLEVMVQACVGVGYEYIAITDHSERAAASRTVTLDQLARQRDEIARVRDRYPGITILHGIEVDILPDGRLDFADAVLEQLDIVLASLHDPARQDPAALTRRCIEAIRHPLVSVITHPANRLVGRRDGYALDFDAVFAAAAETGTALEIDGAPSHLDLDGEHARLAVAAGVTVTIDSDCHRARSLDRQMRLGIGTARRGWVEPRHVLNTRPIDAVRAFIAAKRSGRRR